MTEEREKKWPGYVYWSILPALLLLVLTFGMPNVEAAQSVQIFNVSGGLGNQAEVRAYHQYPDQLVPDEEEFVVSAVLFSDNDAFTVEVTFFETHGDCIETHRHSNVTNSESAALSVVIDMQGGGHCTWHFIGRVLDSQTNPVHAFHLTGNAPTHFPQESDTDRPDTWTLFYVVLLILTLYYGSGLVWLFPIISSVIGLFSTLYDGAFPISPTGALTLYVLAMLLVWYQSRKLERSVK